MGELKPCPFCGGPAVNVAGEYIMCGAPAFLDCAARTIRAGVEAWNIRTPEPAPQDNAEIVERLREALAPFAKALDDWGDDTGQPDRWTSWEHPIAMNVTLGDFRRAAAAIRALATPIQGEI